MPLPFPKPLNYFYPPQRKTQSSRHTQQSLTWSPALLVCSLHPHPHCSFPYFLPAPNHTNFGLPQTSQTHSPGLLFHLSTYSNIGNVLPPDSHLVCSFTSYSSLYSNVIFSKSYSHSWYYILFYSSSYSLSLHYFIFFKASILT